MIRSFILITIFITSGILPGLSAAAAELPPAPDPSSISTKVLPADEHRNVVVRTCAVCHPPELVVAQHRTADKWDEVIARMVDHGARASEEELDNIFAYFIKHFSATSKNSSSNATAAAK